MSGSFGGIETASRALRAFQRQLDTTGHNIANVNTKGYSRQTVDLAATDPARSIEGKLLSIGTGVSVASINRIKDQLMEARRQGILGDQGRAEGNLSNLERVQSSFLDIDGRGITNALDYFYNSWSALGSNPTSLAAKQQVQNAGADLAKRVRDAFANLDGLSQGTDKQIQQTMGQIQSLGNKISSLNTEIKKNIAAGGSPNDQMDQRDEAIAELSKLVNVQTNSAPDGTTSVFIGSFTLVDQVGAREFPANYDSATSTVSGNGMSWPITGGKLKGLFDSAGQMSSFKADLDSFANQLRTQVNTIHSGGITGAGTTGQNFFADSIPQTGAKDFNLDPAISANPTLIATGSTTAKGDGSIAIALSGLRDQKIPALGNQTIGNLFTSLISTVGTSVRNAKNNVETSYTLSEQLDQQIQDVSGVNMDDEMANMLRFQRSYQAAAKILNMMDENVGTLIDMLRR